MGRKSREAMEQARRSLDARKDEALGPSAPPCDNPQCGGPLGGLFSAKPSKGTVLIRLPGGGSTIKNVCSPLRCAFDLAGDMSATATYAPHAPGRYRGA